MLFAAFAQSADPAGQVAEGTGVVAVVGFIMVGIGAVIGARLHRKRRG